jgi:hypothetical protein
MTNLNGATIDLEFFVLERQQLSTEIKPRGLLARQKRD